jgi:hypothetical protein
MMTHGVTSEVGQQICRQRFDSSDAVQQIELLKFITYFGIYCGVQPSNPSGGCAGR